MIGFLVTGPWVAAIYAASEDNKKFMTSLEVMSQEDREIAIAERRDAATKAIEKARCERERAELLEALKPHTLWSFLGLGRK